MIYHLNIGSNLGNRKKNIINAITMLKEAINANIKQSNFIESEAWGFDSDNKFMNIAIAFESDITPMEMLNITQGVEKQTGSNIHRNIDGSYCDRLIDIDIIAIDELIIEEATLTIPHPRMHLREFVLRPMSELFPDWIHPSLKKSITELLSAL